MYQDKIDAAIALIKLQNDVIGQGKAGYIDVEKFTNLLKAYGAVTEDDLKKLSWENILDILNPAFDPKPEVLPKLLAEKLANIFRDKTGEYVSEDKKRPVSSKKAERMTPRELVECFDPEESDSPIGMRLKSISRGEPFIVFAQGRLLDIESTFKLLMEVKQGYSGVVTTNVNGNIKPVYKLGQLPDAYAEENPLYPGRPLRPDGTCDQTGRSWAGVDLKIRQFIRLAIEQKVIPQTIDGAHNTLDLALQPDALIKLRQRYAAISVKFDELEQLGQLPRLQISLLTQKEAQKGVPARPFDDGKRVEWITPGTGNPYANYYVASNSGTLSNYIAKKR